MSKNPDLKATLNLPRTRFPMKASLPQREPEILEWWGKQDVYGELRRQRAGRKPYVLHDGPPYANGNIHLGHALNKVLKDFVLKSRSMAGFDATFVPGWDCHGLPIEHHLDRHLGSKKEGMSILEFRGRCRAYAEKYIGIQSKEFRRLGVFWDPGAIYRTIDRSYEAEIVRQLGAFFANGSVYHGVKPVHWCSSCRTALAEAEVEYMDRNDPSVYVKFPVRGLASRVPELDGRETAFVIWTTTPWTLPANLAVTLHPELTYVAVERGTEALIVAEGLLPAVSAALEWDAPRVIARFSGRDLVGQGDDWVGREIAVERPYHAPSGAAAGEGVMILGDHVTLDAGTGVVHTAPGHGADDFHVGQRYGLETFNPVADDGTFVGARVAEPWLAGRHVLEANQAIVEDLRSRGWLLLEEDYRHSYPHCWRCRNPVLFRSTPQWFISMEGSGLREGALEQLHRARWKPESGEERLARMVRTRPDWCISRQRSWGVPIPAIVCEDCLEDHADAFIRDARFFDHVARLFLEEGSNAWFGKPGEGGGHRPYDTLEQRLERLLPAELACPVCGRRDALGVHEHIVDVWFESGVSHAAVLGASDRLPWPADLYLEGHDQFRGWFQSSLLVGVNGSGAPFREVLSHGFALDAQGRKMSKTLGNVISPLDVAGKRGAEILRMWISMVDILEDVRLSEETLDRNAEAYRKIRNTFRYLLGNLHGFDPQNDRVAYAEMPEIDRWILQRLEELRQRITGAYEDHRYHLVYHGLHNFASVTLSSFYLDILKDRLYTYPEKHPDRRAAQTALFVLADSLCRLMAPVLCFTAEEVWQQLAALEGQEVWGASSVHTRTFPDALVAERDPELLQRWQRMGQIREEINKALELARNDKRIGTALEARVVIEADEETTEFLRSFGEGLRFVLITSGVEFATAGDGAFHSEAIPGLAIAVHRAGGDKCSRCWHYTTDVGGDAEWPEVCGRCAGHIRLVHSGPRS